MSTPRQTIKLDLWDTMKPPLRAAGFNTFKSNCAFRHLEDRIDVVELRMANPGENVSSRTPSNSFVIEVAVFFRFAPHPMGRTFDGEESLPVKSSIDGHFRILSRPNRLLRTGWNSPWWRVDCWYLRKRLILPDVSRNIEKFLIPWFLKFNNLDDVYEHILSINASGGGQQTTRQDADSWGWVYGFKTLPAFFALRLKRWDKAKEYFSALLDEPHPGHKNSPHEYPDKLYKPIEDKLRQGLAEATSKLS